jgi:hypothetical protein
MCAVQHGGAVGIFVQQGVFDVLFDQCGIAQDGLPVIVLHPVIVVGANPAQLFNRMRLLGDMRRFGQVRVHGQADFLRNILWRQSQSLNRFTSGYT